MTGDILFDTFNLMAEIIGAIGTPIMIMCGGLVLLALILKLK